MAEELLKIDHVPTGASVASTVTQRLSRLLRNQLGTVLTQHSGFGLTDWRMFVGLSQKPGSTQKELVEFAQMEQAQVSRSLALMKERGLITSVRSRSDKRAWLFSLTSKGQTQFERLLPLVRAYCEGIDAVLTPREMKLYLDMAQRIARACMETDVKVLAQNKKAG